MIAKIDKNMKFDSMMAGSMMAISSGPEVSKLKLREVSVGSVVLSVGSGSLSRR